ISSRRSVLPRDSSSASSSTETSKWSSIAFLPRPVTRMMLSRPEATASSTPYWMIGLSTSGSISFGCAFVAGRKRVPRPAAGNTALRTDRLTSRIVSGGARTREAHGFLGYTSTSVPRITAALCAAAAAAWIAHPATPFAQGGGARADSPASQRPPQSAVPQTYEPAQVEAGRAIFAAQCGFCHGRDAMGGETGPDLTRSALAAADVRGDRIGPVVRAGRPDTKMPGFTLSDADLLAVVAFIHEAKSRADTLEGGRRSVDVADLQTGDAAAGRQYFEGAGGCTACHSATGDLAVIGTLLSGLALMEEMLSPAGRGARGARPPAATVMVT